MTALKTSASGSHPVGRIYCTEYKRKQLRLHQTIIFLFFSNFTIRLVNILFLCFEVCFTSINFIRFKEGTLFGGRLIMFFGGGETRNKKYDHSLIHTIFNFYCYSEERIFLHRRLTREQIIINH